MPGLVPGIQVVPRVLLDVDGRDKPGHDALARISHTILGYRLIQAADFCLVFIGRT